MKSKTIEDLKVTVSDGNKKLGKIPNVSMPPILACRHSAPCRHRTQCYAVKLLAYPSVDKAWTENYKVASTDPVRYFATIREYLNRKVPRFFRWHVSGDILDQAYLDEMKLIAREYPQTKFLAFTKMFELVYGRVPSNLQIVFSMWPGMKVPANRRFKRAWLSDKRHDSRIPSDAIECPGECSSCFMCWHLKELGRDVYFEKH
jgi:hypothetical protein